LKLGAALADGRPPSETHGDGRSSTAQQVELSAEVIRAILPHRWPFLMIDRVTQVDPGREATGIKCVSSGEIAFLGHFPEMSVFPGVLIVEAIAQLAGVMVGTASVKRVNFRRPIVPGDVMRIHVQRTGGSTSMTEVAAKVTVNGHVCAEGSLVVAHDPTSPPNSTESPKNSPAAVEPSDLNNFNTPATDFSPSSERTVPHDRSLARQ
jgi:3-hydroxyacyl-[acyl-carrier-protein] dehydratase